MSAEQSCTLRRRIMGAGGSGGGRFSAPKLPKLSVPKRGAGRQQGETVTPQDSARRAPPSNRAAQSPSSPGVLYVD